MLLVHTNSTILQRPSQACQRPDSTANIYVVENVPAAAANSFLKKRLTDGQTVHFRQSLDDCNYYFFLFCIHRLSCRSGISEVAIPDIRVRVTQIVTQRSHNKETMSTVMNNRASE